MCAQHRNGKIARMSALSAASVAAAAQRLAGHLVATPLIGTPWLGSGSTWPDVRWKPDLLQPGGSAWFRGYQHFLLRQLGRCAGLVWHGPATHLLAVALAAHQHRLALHAWCEEPLPDGLQALLPPEVTLHQAGGATAAAAKARQLGYTPIPADHPEVQAGLSTIGWELAPNLPHGCRRVFAPSSLVAAVAAGLALAGRPMEVLAGAGPILPALRDALWHGHGVQASDEALAVLSTALAEPVGSCAGAVLG